MSNDMAVNRLQYNWSVTYFLAWDCRCIRYLQVSNGDLHEVDEIKDNMPFNIWHYAMFLGLSHNQFFNSVANFSQKLPLTLIHTYIKVNELWTKRLLKLISRNFLLKYDRTWIAFISLIHRKNGNCTALDY